MVFAFHLLQQLWQCGGRVLIQPCSHVGHLFRSASPYTFPREGGVGSVLQQNFARVAEVWMDQWKEFFYKLNPGEPRSPVGSDLGIHHVLSSIKHHLRESVLKCRGFEYFLKEAWDEHFMPNASRIVGQIVNAHFPSRCLQRVAPNDEVQVADCVQPGKMWYPPQIFIGTEKGMIRGDEATCLDSPDERRVFAATCIAQNVNQQWKMKNGMFVHSASSLCLDLSSTNKKAVLRSCDVSVQQQYWTFQSLPWEVRVD
ncbi:unnamed protein product [Cyprideis torosa]|uniref:Uncharacterized protein n=1 Tax=Cyprideis torosa TaxID=163714 RepID=A0A7R8WCF8_9CRUS|nr:unnamed protein product [Cyprideis torosa]CAG0890730.1 unnamed protein product [Cyprideis torosa]